MKNYSCLNDEKLVSLCKENDQGAWDELYKRYLTVASIVSNRFADVCAEKDDMIQEGILGLMAAVASYKSDGAARFSTYAGTCIKNRIVNFVRNSSAKGFLGKNAALQLFSDEEIADTALTPDELAVLKSEATRAQHAINSTLTQREREVFNFYLCSMTYEEIAQKLNMSVKAVDGALQRAKKKLKKEFEN